jgi:Flp pilus assembly protein TadD
VKPLSGVTALLVLLVLTSAVPNLAAEKNWYQIETQHFSVVSEVGPKRGVEIAERCEQMRTAFSLLMNRATTHDPAPLLIFALNGVTEVDALGSSGAQSRHSGLFLPGSDESFILLDASDDPWRTLFHEYAHELLNANTSPEVQTWFEEGFSEYFSTIHSAGQRVELGRVPLNELEFLRKNGKLMRLADLVGVNQNSTIYRLNTPAQQLFYAESWLLVHYLFDYGLISRAQPFFAVMAAGSPLDAAVQSSFGMTTQKLEDELRSYARGEKFRFYSLPLPQGAGGGKLKTAPLSQVSVKALKALVRWHSRSHHSTSEAADYAGELKPLLDREPRNATTLRALGMALLQLGDYENSFTYLRRATAASPADVRTHHALGLLLARAESNGQSRLPSDLSSQNEAEICVQLDPAFADAYHLLAVSFLRRGEFDKAERNIRKAADLSPRTESYKLNLADIELRERNYAAALGLLQQLENSSNPEIAKEAKIFLSSNTEQK